MRNDESPAPAAASPEVAAFLSAARRYLAVAKPPLTATSLSSVIADAGRGGAMHILGLDFATKTGVAYGDAGSPAARIVTETWTLPSGGGADVGAIMHALRERLEDRILRGVQLVVFEAPYVAVHRDYRGHPHFSTDQIRRAFGMAALCEEICYARGVRCCEAITVTLKKEFGGSGRAQKADMIAAAKRRGFNPANDHEADALACFVHGVAHFAPEHVCTYDPIFAGGAR